MNTYPPGSFVKHINRSDVPLWVVIGSSQGAHLLKSIPIDGTYEIIRGDGNNLVWLDANTMKLGVHSMVNCNVNSEEDAYQTMLKGNY